MFRSVNRRIKRFVKLMRRSKVLLLMAVLLGITTAVATERAVSLAELRARVAFVEAMTPSVPEEEISALEARVEKLQNVAAPARLFELEAKIAELESKIPIPIVRELKPELKGQTVALVAPVSSARTTDKATFINTPAGTVVDWLGREVTGKVVVVVGKVDEYQGKLEIIADEIYEG